MDNSNWINILLYVVGILFWILLITTIVAYFVLNSKARELAKNHSRRLAGIISLNERFVFATDIRPKYDYRVVLPNKRSFDSFEPYSYFGGLVSTDLSNYEKLFKSLEDNKQKYPEYCNEIAMLPTEIPQEVCQKHTRVPYSLVNHNEKRLIYAVTQRPVMDSKVVFHVRYTSPKGRKSYYKEYVCMMSQLSANYYHHVVTNSMKAFQRSLMTDSLRYDVMKRDGFRCVLCGRTANDGVVLHVDHIFPVAKGGKTEMNNLRTLCEYCNLGKSAKYDPNGLN